VDTPSKSAGRTKKSEVHTAAAASPAKAHPLSAAATLHTEAHRICPGCGTELVDRGCKMRCLRCGFFLDCSDG